MTLEEAFGLTLDLAESAVLDDDSDPDLQEERKRQIEALEITGKMLRYCPPVWRTRSVNHPRDPSKPVLLVERGADGVWIIDINTEDFHPGDTWGPPDSIPKLRVRVNAEMEGIVTQRDGSWCDQEPRKAVSQSVQVEPEDLGELYFMLRGRGCSNLKAKLLKVLRELAPDLASRLDESP